MKVKLALAGALLISIGLGFVYFKSDAERRRIESELASSRAEVERLQAEGAELKNKELSETELARLKADQAEAIKLRGEVSNLKRSLATAQKAAADAQKLASASASAKTNRLSRPSAELVTG